MFSRARAFFFAAAAVALAFSGPALATAHHTATPVVNASKKRKRGEGNNLVHPYSSSLVGKSSLRLSVAQGKRRSAKRRNQLRHKRHMKG
jgi:hypothetical protein